MKVNVRSKADPIVVWMTFRELFKKRCFGVRVGGMCECIFQKSLSLCHKGFLLNQNMLLESLQSKGGRFAVEQRWMACLTTLPAQCVL